MKVRAIDAKSVYESIRTDYSAALEADIITQSWRLVNSAQARN